MLRVLDLFSGIGGFSLELERAGFKTVAFCEIEKYPRSILKKHWPNVPIFEDVRTLDGKQFKGAVELICGGFPCQPFSVAGKQRGQKDDRHLWPEMLRIIREVKPPFVVCENVAGFIRLALDDVLSDLESEGYTCQTFVIPACAIGAVHRRDRVWIIAYTEHDGPSTSKVRRGVNSPGDDNEERTKETGKSKRSGEFEIGRNIQSSSSEDDSYSNGSGWGEGDKEVARGASEQLDRFCIQSSKVNTDSCGSELQRGSEKQIPGIVHLQGELVRRGEAIGIVFDPSKPAISGVCNGFPGRVDRVKALGNAVVPQIPEMIGRAIIESFGIS